MRFLLQASHVLYERPQNRMPFLFKASFLGHAPVTKISGNLLPRACPKKIGNFMISNMPTENFRNLNTVRFPKATKISEILVAGKVLPVLKFPNF